MVLPIFLSYNLNTIVLVMNRTCAYIAPNYDHGVSDLDHYTNYAQNCKAMSVCKL